MRRTRAAQADRRELDEAIVRVRRALTPAGCTRAAMAIRLGVAPLTIRGWELRLTRPDPDLADQYESAVVAWAAAEGMPVPGREEATPGWARAAGVAPLDGGCDE